MAKYNYDEAGNMAAYFLTTFLALILVPSTIASIVSSKKSLHGCPCNPCIEQRKRIKSISRRGVGKNLLFIMMGWLFLAYLSYKISNTKFDNNVYNPFEILGIHTGSSEKEIKSHYKKLSKLYHPDKVKVTANNTIEEIQNRFVALTKAYKALTDETIRENLEKYGHPDGRQDISMGIALPKWVVEGKNNIWVLGVYGILFGGALPFLVGRWWFGSRQKTKDGVHALSAAAFFMSLKEEPTLEQIIGAFCRAYRWELPHHKAVSNTDLDLLEKFVRVKMDTKWSDLKKICEDDSAGRGLILLYAHFLRISLNKASLQQEQRELLLHTPVLLNALLNISIARNWWIPTLMIMRLHAYLAQALLPSSDHLTLIQLPAITCEDLKGMESGTVDFWEVFHTLEVKKDSRAVDVKKVIQKWGRVEVVDAAFKVIGDRVVTPSSIVFLVVKLRLSPPPFEQENHKQSNAEDEKHFLSLNEEKDEKFLVSRKEAEDLLSDNLVIGAAHAPYWPAERKPSWWLVLADEKSNRIVVPPTRITDIPFSQQHSSSLRNFRAYKIQFQAPQAVGTFTWKVHLISDTFVGEDVSSDITLKIEDFATLNSEEPSEDEISDPDEDTIAGQMAAMRGDRFKTRTKEDEESDEESSTDDGDDTQNSSDSDSD